MRPPALPPRFENVPPEIRPLPQWVAWRFEFRPGARKWAKVPVSPDSGEMARTNSPCTWASFEKAVDFCQSKSLDGIGFVFTPDDPFCGVDLDHCRDRRTGQLTQPAEQQVRRLGSYTEISPSGTGLKCIVKGTLPAGNRRAGNLELYNAGQYFTITGHILEPYRKIVDSSGPLAALRASLAPTGPAPSTARELPATQLAPLNVPDHTILRRARNAKNGSKFQRLWNGNLSDARQDHSVADLMLCRLLAFWCGPRPRLVDRLFRQSELFRPKWDEKHYSDGRTYGVATIRKAIQDQNAFFHWRPPATRGSLLAQ